jgi:hypothetical protein
MVAKTYWQAYKSFDFSHTSEKIERDFLFSSHVYRTVFWRINRYRSDTDKKLVSDNLLEFSAVLRICSRFRIRVLLSPPDPFVRFTDPRIRTKISRIRNIGFREKFLQVQCLYKLWFISKCKIFKISLTRRGFRELVVVLRNMPIKRIFRPQEGNEPGRRSETRAPLKHTHEKPRICAKSWTRSERRAANGRSRRCGQAAGRPLAAAALRLSASERAPGTNYERSVPAKVPCLTLARGLEFVSVFRIRILFFPVV